MRVLALCLLSLALTTFVPAPASGQIDPCEPDCFETKFTQPLRNHTIELPGKCKIQVTYTWRYACNRYWDLYIEYIQTQPPPTATCQLYWDLPPKELLWLVTEKMIEDNPMADDDPTFVPKPFPKPIMDCTTDWRVVRGGCWFKAYEPFSNSYSSSYCEGEGCCLSPFQVCFDACGNVTCFEPQPYPNPPAACFATPGHPECTGVCDLPSWSQGDTCEPPQP